VLVAEPMQLESDLTKQLMLWAAGCPHTREYMESSMKQCGGPASADSAALRLQLFLFFFWIVTWHVLVVCPLSSPQNKQNNLLGWKLNLPTKLLPPLALEAGGLYELCCVPEDWELC
jgi:hypothetical protein